MFEAITIILTIVSIIGVWLNIKKMRACFYLWSATNFSWMIVDFYREIYAQSALFFIYFILAIYGFFAWRPENEKGL